MKDSFDKFKDHKNVCLDAKSLVKLTGGDGNIDTNDQQAGTKFYFRVEID